MAAGVTVVVEVFVGLVPCIVEINLGRVPVGIRLESVLAVVHVLPEMEGRDCETLKVRMG